MTSKKDIEAAGAETTADTESHVETDKETEAVTANDESVRLDGADSAEETVPDSGDNEMSELQAADEPAEAIDREQSDVEADESPIDDSETSDEQVTSDQTDSDEAEEIAGSDESEESDENDTIEASDTEASVEFEGDRPIVKELVYQAPRGNQSKDDLEESEALKFASVAEAKSVVEGFLFSCNEPLTVSKLSKLMNNLHPKTVRGLLLELQWEYENRPGALQVIEIAGGYQMSTRAHVAPWMFRMHKHKRRSALSPATLETLAIVAYRQPITKGEIETIRGVESGAPLRTLQDLNMVEASGRREVIGRPQLYITTEQFLKTFGLKSVADLPSISELKNRFAEEQKLKRVVAETPKPAEPQQAEDETASPDASESADAGADEFADQSADIALEGGADLEEEDKVSEAEPATDSEDKASGSSERQSTEHDDIDDIDIPESGNDDSGEEDTTSDNPDDESAHRGDDGQNNKHRQAHQAFLDEQSLDEA